MRTLILGTVLVPALAACTRHSRDDDLRARLRSFIGQPFTAYWQATGSAQSV
ncbi:hypothetical protein HEQ69_06450 [Haematospirillum jordaniae]|uniref:hypothetical protein n=1 Tax=Haematospirillum jordaniae TaxID=1549855 RepID=UPI00143281BB|nr:hypothetical protein [Haematospirillum jordaniae]NKD45357.1 hypothetical protein [Haematospirillum jordaniae]